MAKSRRITRFFEVRMGAVCAVWLLIAGGLALARMAFPASPVHNLRDAAPIVLAYSLVLVAPILGYLIARHAFVGEAAVIQPTYRLAIFGRWRRLSHAEATRRRDFGAVGFMASLLIGLLLNVVVRTFEFFTSVPAMSAHAPDWGMALFTFMAVDVVVTSFFYMAAFAMALRTIPLFPRMLLLAWMVDIFMQLVVAQRIAAVGSVPTSVAEPLITLLNGNITKVLISMLIWLPYLMLSERVNVTYRHRTEADA